MSAFNQDGTINQNMQEIAEQRSLNRLRQEIEFNTLRLQEWANSLDEGLKEKIAIRAYTPFPTTTYIFVDPEHSNGYVQVEILLYKIGKNYKNISFIYTLFIPKSSI